MLSYWLNHLKHDDVSRFASALLELGGGWQKEGPLEALDRALGCRRRVEKHAAIEGACDGLFGGHKSAALWLGKIHRTPSQTD